MHFIRPLTICSFVLATMCAMAQDVNADQAAADRGKLIYEQNCLVCHQADGSGVPGLAPPLIKGAFVNADKERLVRIILDGMEGVEINGEYYANPMPAFDYLSDSQIADVLTYVRGGFSNDAPPITTAEVARVRNE